MCPELHKPASPSLHAFTYAVYNIQPVMAGEIARRGAALSSLDRHFNRPPVQDLEFEMDCRAVCVEYAKGV